MNPAAVSFLVQIPPSAEEAVARVLDSARLPHADPAQPVNAGLHFFSMVLLPADRLNGDDAVWLSVEASIDTLEEEAAAALCRLPAIRAVLAKVAAAAGVAFHDTGGLVRWLEANQLPFGTQLAGPQGLAFCGTPGMSASRIRIEARLADWVRMELPKAGATGSALQRLRAVRAQVFGDAELKHALFSEQTQLLEPGRPTRALVFTVAWAAARDYLWYLLLAPAMVLLACIVLLPWIGPWLKEASGLDLGRMHVAPLLLAAIGVLAAMAVVERIRLARLGLLWLLLAPLAVAAAALALQHHAALDLFGLRPEDWQGLARLLAATGFAFGVMLALRLPLRWWVRLVALVALAICLACTALPPWPEDFPAWAVCLAWALGALGLAAAVVLNLLLLASGLQATSTRLQTKARLAMVVGTAVLAAHLAINPQAQPAMLRIFAALLALELVGLVWAAWVGYRRLRDQEEGDRPVDREPDNDALKAILNHENQPGVVQNHLAAQSIIKPGWHRVALLRLAIWVIGQITAARSPAGFLGRIGTIHHARWLLIPKTRRLIFLSNYDGSWQSYLEDFISRLREGLSSLWSNTQGFPRTFSLISGGASDGSRFKRWARRQQVPSAVWFSGYPDLSTAAIRTNAEIRLGLAAAQTEREAHRWLIKLGEATPMQLEQSKIPSLVLGGMSAFAHSALLVLRFGGDAQTLLRRLKKYVPHGLSGARRKRAITIGLSFNGLKKLGMQEGDETFKLLPSAFVQGMADPNRARMLGDTYGLEAQASSSEPRPWGTGQAAEEQDDAAILIYGVDARRLARTLQLVRTLAEKAGHTVTWAQEHQPAWSYGSQAHHAAKGPSVANVLDARDGLSQPIIRGLQGSRDAQNSIHVLEPGEIVLGYPDNLRKRIAEPAGGGVNHLKNGSFLVIRQLRFDRTGFDSFLQAQAQRLLPSNADAAAQIEQQKWLAAKMLGRWPSGASLVRAPDADPNDGKNENDFLYGREDPSGARCPLGSHARRMNPRDSLAPGSRNQLAITNRHRILRVSRRYRLAQTEGLMFMCLNADIERQFEFLQQTWALGAGFHGLDGEVDPLLGPGTPALGFSIPGESGAVRLAGLPRFVSLVGGGYFLVPGKDYLEALTSGSAVPAPGASP